MSNSLEQAIRADDGNRAAKMIGYRQTLTFWRRRGC